MTEHDVREWFGNRGYPLNEKVKLTFSVVKKCGQNWLFLKDDCHDFEGYDWVESYYLDTNCCEPYDGWKAKGFSWKTEDLEALIDTMEGRIKIGEACDYIDLNTTENNLYQGCGWAIAHTQGDVITKLIYVNQFELGSEEEEAKAEINDALESGNCWFGMCSCHQFCEPRKITENDPKLLARIMRLSMED